jgi:hypothetical protein
VSCFDHTIGKFILSRSLERKADFGENANRVSPLLFVDAMCRQRC